MVGVGLLGTGFMAKAHTYAYRTIPVLMGDIKPRLVAVYGRSGEKARALAEAYGFEKYYTDWRDVVRDPEVEVVDIVLPNFLHRDPAVAAAEEGRAVLCEKPLGRSLKEALEMVRAVEKAGVVNGVVFNKRWFPAVRLAKKLVEEGVVGRIRHFRFAYHQDWGLRGSAMGWRFSRREAGYGVVGDQGSHVVDLVQFLVGRVRRVVAISRVVVGERVGPGGRSRRVDVEDVSYVLAEAGDAVGSIEASRASLGRGNHLVFEIYGDEGSIAWDMERLNELWVATRDAPEVEGFRRVLVTGRDHPFYRYFWPAGHTIGWAESFTIQMHSFLRSVASGEGFRPDFRDGAAVNAVLDAVYRSMETGGWVEVPQVP